MKEKIFQKLKQGYSHLGLGDGVLLAHAEALNAMGLVTDENIETVIAAQKTFLENLQSENDRRVTDATAKARATAKKEFEDAAAKKAEEERRRKEEEEERRRKEEELPDWYVKEKKANEELIQSLTKDRKELLDGFKAMKEESERLKLEKAATERKNLIISKAKELGIPQYRIDEGFSIAEDADEKAIADHLTTVSNNIKTQTLPGSRAVFPKADGKPDAAEVDAIAKSLVG